MLPEELVHEIWKSVSQLVFQDVLYELRWFWIRKKLDKRLIGPQVFLRDVRGLRCTNCVPQSCLCQLKNIQSRCGTRLPWIQCRCDRNIQRLSKNCSRCKNLCWAPAFVIHRK